MTSAGSPVTSTSPFPTSACRSFRRWSRASSGPTTGSTSWRSRCRHRATPATAARRRDRRRTRSAPGRGGSTSPERRPGRWPAGPSPSRTTWPWRACRCTTAPRCWTATCRTRTPPWSSGCWTPAAPSSARRSARACASPAAATPPTADQSATPTTRPAAPAGPPAGRRRWWPPARWTWPSAATRAARSASRAAGAASTGSSRPGGWCPTPGRSRSRRPSTIGGLSEDDVDGAVREAARAFAKRGAEVEEVSIPWHRDAMPVWNAVALEGATAIMVAGESMAYGAKGRYATSLVDAFGAGRRDRGERLSETVKLTVLAGRWMAEAHHGRYYAKAQNLSRVAAAAYDSVLADHDLLVMPTLPLKATLIPAPDAPLEEQVARALEMIPNTAPFDVTGHPAMNVPCAMSAGLPVGMMLVGRHGDEPTILQAAHAFETEVWNPPPP